MVPRTVSGLVNFACSVATLERFRAKWVPVRVKKTRQNNNLEIGSDSIRTRSLQPAALAKSGCLGGRSGPGPAGMRPIGTAEPSYPVGTIGPGMIPKQHEMA